MVIVFDLDDTLYEELTFVYSGLRAVSDYLSPILNLSREEIFEELVQELQNGRSFIFDRFLEKQEKKTARLIKNCLRVYRGHEPNIYLYPEADACLEQFKNYPLYVVTDGNKIVQKRKCLALGLPSRVRRCFYTYAHGRHRRKPSPYCFEYICRLENVNPSEVVYIADNPHKDFIGIKPLGFKTIRVLTGQNRDVIIDAEHEAHLVIHDLSELNEPLLQFLLKGK